MKVYETKTDCLDGMIKKPLTARSKNMHFWKRKSTFKPMRSMVQPFFHGDFTLFMQFLLIFTNLPQAFFCLLLLPDVIFAPKAFYLEVQ